MAFLPTYYSPISFGILIYCSWARGSRCSNCVTGWSVRGWSPGRGNRFFASPKLPDRHWGPPSTGAHPSLQSSSGGKERALSEAPPVTAPSYFITWTGDSELFTGLSTADACRAVPCRAVQHKHGGTQIYGHQRFFVEFSAAPVLL